MSNTKYAPVGNNIIVRKIQDKLAAGLAKSDSAMTEEKAIGIVERMPEYFGGELFGGLVKVGTKIIYRELNGDTIPNEPDLLIIDNRNDILAVVEE